MTESRKLLLDSVASGSLLLERDQSDRLVSVRANGMSVKLSVATAKYEDKLNIFNAIKNGKGSEDPKYASARSSMNYAKSKKEEVEKEVLQTYNLETTVALETLIKPDAELDDWKDFQTILLATESQREHYHTHGLRKLILPKDEDVESLEIAEETFFRDKFFKAENEFKGLPESTGEKERKKFSRQKMEFFWRYNNARQQNLSFRAKKILDTTKENAVKLLAQIEEDEVFTMRKLKVRYLGTRQLSDCIAEATQIFNELTW